jgi:TRAP-type C4-dicarboxylate transport system substrate-binding protein
MEMKKLFKVMIVVGVAMLWITGSLMSAHGAPVTIRTVGAWPPTTFEAKQFTIFMDMAQKEADQKYPGQMKIDYKGAGEVIQPTQQVEALRSGMVDMILSAASYYVSIMPEMDTMSLTQLYPWEERKSGATDYLDRIHNTKAKVHYLGRLGSGSLFHLFMTKPVQKVDDFKGMKIRVSPTHIPFMKALGAEPVVTAPAEIYTAIERGLVVGYIQPPVVIRDLGLVPVTKYMVYPGFYQPIIVVLVNLDFWNKLPNNLKTLLTQNIEKAEHIAIENIQNRVKSELDAFKKDGIGFIEFPPAEAARFSKMADDALMDVVTKKSPEEAKKIKELTTKK